jgi:hypothetical protein
MTMRCYLCGRRLARPAATVVTDGNTGHAGPTCARKAGLLPPTMARRAAPSAGKRVVRVEAQMELVA